MKKIVVRNVDLYFIKDGKPKIGVQKYICSGCKLTSSETSETIICHSKLSFEIWSKVMDKYYPLSQECSVCGNIDKKYKNLLERVYKCSKCQSEIDRDINVSINIMYEGLKIYMKEVRI